MTLFAHPTHWVLGALLIASSLGVIVSRKPVHSCLSFLLALLALAALYLQLSAQFIAVMQILVYAGAILVIFMFVIILFQDAYQQIALVEARSNPLLLTLASLLFLLVLGALGMQLLQLPLAPERVSADFGTVQSLGRALYIDFFFPFEAVILIFLVAVVGTLYIGKRVR